MRELIFHNHDFEEVIRNTLQVYDRPLCTSDAASVLALDGSDFWMDEEDYETLAAFCNLKELYVEAFPAILPFIGKLTQLESLSLVLNADTVDLRYIADLKKLKQLFVSGGDYSSMNILHLDALTEMDDLEELSLHEFGSVDLKPLEKMTQLTCFFCGYANQVQHLSSVATLTNLTELRLVDIKAESLDFLDSLPDTIELDLCGTKVLKNYDLQKLKRFAKYDLSEMIIAGKSVLPQDLLHLESSDPFVS